MPNDAINSMHGNQSSIDGKSHALTKAYTMVTGSGKESTDYAFGLMLVGGSLDASDIFKTGIFGKGDMINFRIRTASPDDLSVGTYSFSEGL